MISALVPVKAAAAGKERLADALSPSARAALVEAMLRDVVAALRAAPAIHDVWVTSPDAAMLALARSAGARPLPEPPGTRGLNGALAAAIAHLAGAGAGAVLVVQGDLPGITPAAVAALLVPAPPSPCVRAVPTADGGTSALLLCPPAAIAPAFGPESFARHAAAAARAGVPFARVDLPALARDLDRPEDLAAALRDGAGHWTRQALLRATGQEERTCKAREGGDG